MDEPFQSDFASKYELKDRGDRTLVRSKMWKRRQLVSMLNLRHFTIQATCDYIKDEHPELDCCFATIQRDLAALKAQWRLGASQTIEEAINAELKKMDLLEETANELIAGGELMDGAKIMIAVCKARRQLLGLDKAKKITLIDSNTEDLSRSQLQQLLRDLEQEANAIRGEEGESVSESDEATS
jgi:hypothetical protein